jgi:prophage regulatory protein
MAEQVLSQAIIRLPVVKQRTGLSRSTIYLRAAQGEFPAPIKLGARASGWIADEVDAWIAARIAATRESPSS